MRPGAHRTLGRCAVALLALLTLAPLVMVVARALVPGPVPTLRHFAAAMNDPANVDALVTTLAVAGATVVGATAVAVPLAWLVSRTDLPGARLLRVVLAVPYVVPPYLGAIAWINLANPTVGWLNRLAGNVVFDIYTVPGMVWVLALFYYTFVYIGCLAALERMDASLEDAARMSGAGPLLVLRTITLPLVRPAVLAGGFLVFAASASAFGVPALVGAPGRIQVLTTRVYAYVRGGGLDGLYTGAALSVALLAIAVAAWVVAERLQGTGPVTTVGGKGTARSRVSLGAWRWPALAGVLAFVLVVCVLPVIAVVLTSLMQVVGDFRWSNFTLDKYRYVLFTRPDTSRGFFNSFVLASATATLAVVVGTVIGYVKGHPSRRASRVVDLAVALPFAAPGTIIALGLILVWSWPLALIDSLWIILIAYFAKHLSFAVGPITTAVRQTDNSLEEAARVAGATPAAAVRTIWLPLLRPALLAGWFLVFMPAFGELTMSILLVGPGTDTVGTVLFALQEYADPAAASVVAVLILGCILTAYVAAAALSPR
jgi:iron(III) transport system permease protein